MKLNFKKILQISGFSLLAFCSQAYAAGYKLELQSTSILADAGDAAVVEDAGTNWYNSAGLVYLPQQLVTSAIDVYAPTTFSGTAIAPSAVPPPFGLDFQAVGEASSHPNFVLPALHYNLPLNSDISFGISVVPAWGFSEDYGNDSIVRYDLKRVYSRSIDIAPSLAFRLNNQWSFGLGPDFHYLYAVTKNHVRTEGVPFGTPNDSIIRFSGDQWAKGAHAGILYRISGATRIGLNYRTRILMDLAGNSYFILNGDGVFNSHAFTLRVPLPPTTTLSIYHDVTPCWAMMGTIAYDQWSILNRYIAKNLITPAGIVPFVELPQEMRDTVDLGIGTHYQWNDRWMIRASMKFEPTPTRNRFRDINFPDGQRLGFQIGARYQVNKRVALDMLYGHVFVQTSAINGLNPLSLATTVGHNKTSVELFGGQLVWDI